MKFQVLQRKSLPRAGGGAVQGVEVAGELVVVEHRVLNLPSVRISECEQSLLRSHWTKVEQSAARTNVVYIRDAFGGGSTFL